MVAPQMDLLDELQSKVICGDGAMGTMLLNSGASLAVCLEEIAVSDPDRISKIHDQYIDAGARVIRTNTFGANAVRLERFGFDDRVAEFNMAAADLALNAAEGKNVYVAGSVGPLGITAAEATARGIDRTGCFREQIQALRERGVQLIFLETFVDFEEMANALRSAKEAECLTNCMLVVAPNGRLTCETPLEDAFANLGELGADMVGLNCMSGPCEIFRLLEPIQTSDQLVAAYPSAGIPKGVDGQFVYPRRPDRFANVACELILAGARLIGGCCGTTPAHISAMSGAIGIGRS